MDARATFFRHVTWNREWRVFALRRDHISFERLDNMHRFNQMKVMLQNPLRRRFLAFHVRTSHAAGHRWNIARHPEAGAEVLNLLGKE